MKRKELKNLAQQIAQLELQLQSSNDADNKRRIEQSITGLTSRVTNLDDIFLLDELIFDILNKNS